MIEKIKETLSAFGYLSVATAILYTLVVAAPVYVGLKAAMSVLKGKGKETTEESTEARPSAVS